MTSRPERFAGDPREASALPDASRIADESRRVSELLTELGRVIVGQRAMLERLLIGLLADGHVLLEGVPGLAKTLSIRTLAGTIAAQFHRIQFTPDLLPADLIGTMIYNQRSGDFTVQKGPIFTNLLLADEINRAPAKVQSALLEAMQEKQVTIGGQTYPLPELFLVLATQNPIEHEGTYPLPEAQVDRFMFKLVVTYPERREEREVLDRMAGLDEPKVSRVMEPERVVSARRLVQSVYADERIKEYVLDLVGATRRPGDAGLTDLAAMVEFGASPRAAIFLLRAAKAHAFMRGRAYVTPDDVKALALDVLRHRVILTYRADAEGIDSDALLGRILAAVPVP
jgi:MoxR-like ATPase